MPQVKKLEISLTGTTHKFAKAVAKQRRPIAFNADQDITGAVAALKEYWNTYDNQEIEGYTTGILIDDALYGIGIAIDPVKYATAPGYDRFKKDLIQRLIWL